MDCCAKENPNVQEIKELPCPRCHKKGKLVERRTLVSLLKKELKDRVIQEYYLFCSNPSCEVVYYSQAREGTFLKSDVTVPVTVKDPGLVVPLCYCFGISRQDILTEIKTTGTTHAFEDISKKVKEGLCACEIKNPQGGCCLGNVSSWIKSQIKDESGDGP